MNLGKLREIMRGRKAWHAAVHGVAKSQPWLWDGTTTAILKRECDSARREMNINRN